MKDWHRPAKETTTGLPSVLLSNVSCTLADRTALCDLSLDISERRVGIVGRNGSGKSTLARVISGLISPDSGTVLVNDVDVANDRRAALRTVGILFQNPDHQIIFPTVEEELAFGLVQLGHSNDMARAKAHAMLRQFNCSTWNNRLVSELSQGQRHLVCLMAVLAMGPAVLLLDEPFSGLDIPTTNALRRHLDGIAPAIIHITHDPAALDGYDRVIWLDDGVIRQDGPALEVLHDYLVAMHTEDGADACTDLSD